MIMVNVGAVGHLSGRILTYLSCPVVIQEKCGAQGHTFLCLRHNRHAH